MQITFSLGRDDRMETYRPYRFKIESLAVFRFFCSRFVSFFIDLTCVKLWYKDKKTNSVLQLKTSINPIQSKGFKHLKKYDK